MRIFKYGTNAIHKPTSKRNGWIVALLVIGCLITLMALSDGHTEYGYTEMGGRL